MFFLAGALAAATVSANWTLSDIRAVREGEPGPGLLRLAQDTSETADFLRIELSARSGNARGVLDASRGFRVRRPGSELVFRVQLLQGWAHLELGEISRGLDLLASITESVDTVAALQARSILQSWIGAKEVPAASLLRLASQVEPRRDTLSSAIVGAFARRNGASNKGPVIVVLPQTGDFGSIGRRVTEGVRVALAADQAEVIVLDEPTDPVEVARLLRGILQTCHPRALVGPLLSAAATVAAQEVARYSPETPLLLPAATSPGIAALSPNAVQINLSTRAQGAAAARLARNCLKAREAWILHPRGEYGDALAAGFQREFERQGGRIAGRHSWPSGRTDFRGTLESVRKEAAEAAKSRGEDSIRLTPLVFAPCDNSTEASALGAQGAVMPMKPVWLGASGWHTKQIFPEAAGRLEGAYLVTDRIPDTRRPAWKKLAKGWKSKESLDPLAALGYDAGLVLLSERLPLWPEVLAGAAGDISLDPRGRFNRIAPSLKIQKSAFVESGCPSP
ncbi:MAG: amino acid ABC transporter substrate-binding protein [Fibrobacteria bacterium]|nr:amino acid ABC transporter substrate-binding protein [Fibrobacteria bacterium]